MIPLTFEVPLDVLREVGLRELASGAWGPVRHCLGFKWEGQHYWWYRHGDGTRGAAWVTVDVFVDPVKLEALIARHKERIRQYEELLLQGRTHEESVT
jgi:hypothetical protein